MIRTPSGSWVSKRRLPLVLRPLVLEGLVEAAVLAGRAALHLDDPGAGLEERSPPVLPVPVL
jgi:hypothetical protein